MKAFKINYMAAFVIVIYPLLLFFFGFLYWKNFGISKFEIISMIAAFYIFCISVGVGIHRLWAHGCYKANKYVELVLAIVSAGTLQGPVLAWVSDHDNHHSYTDVLGKDPHTPLKYCLLEKNKSGYSAKGKIKGFLWSHMGWMLDGNQPKKKLARTAIQRLGRNKIVMWQFKHYWKIAILVNTLVPSSIGYIIGGSLQYAIAGYIFIGIGRALQQQATFCINSLVHFFGSKEYTNGTAGDMPILFFMFLGENWHNFHHAFPRDYRNGHKWYHLDIHKWIIALMEKVGLATNVVRTPKERIAAKVVLTKEQLSSNMNEQLVEADNVLSSLLKSITKELNANFDQVSFSVNSRLVNLKEQAVSLGRKIEIITSESKAIKQKEIKKILRNIKEIEIDFCKYVGFTN